MFQLSSQAEIKSKDNWRCIPKQKYDQNSSFQSKTQKCTKFTPNQSNNKSKELKFLKALNEKKESSRNMSPLSKRTSKSKIMRTSATNLAKQRQEDRGQQASSIRLQKKGNKSPMYCSYMTNNGSIDISRIAGQGNKSFLDSVISKRGICQLLNLDEKETNLDKDLFQYKKLIKEFKQYLKNELQKMQLSYIHTIYSLKKRYEDEIKEIKASYEEVKRENLMESDRMGSLALDSNHFNSSNASKICENGLRRSKKVGSIVKCKNSIHSSTAENFISSTAQYNSKAKLSNELRYQKQGSMKFHLQSEKSVAEKIQRGRSFEKIFNTLQLLKDTIDDKDSIKDHEEKQKMEISHEEHSQLQNSVKEGQWGFYSFKVPELAVAGMNTPKNIKKITFETGQFFKQQSCKYIEQSDDQNTIQEQSICQILQNKTLKPPLLNYSQDLYGSIRTACFDDNDGCNNQLLSPKYKKKLTNDNNLR